MEKRPHGFDGGKRVRGRKRQLAVDALGLLVEALVHAANIQDLERPAGSGASALPQQPQSQRQGEANHGG